MKKRYTQAPLPFQGQKRYFASSFVEILKELQTPPSIVIDLFGGSGLLSHKAKEVLPDSRVIYNDYDDFHIRLLNIDRTNKLIADLRAIIINTKRDQKLLPAERLLVLQRIENEAKTGYVDYITISSSLLFSCNYALTFEELAKSVLYNTVRMSDYNVDPSDYLAGLEISKCDYMELYNKYKDVPGVIFVIDPPYLSTDTKTYNSDQYWKLKDYLNVLKVLQKNKFVFFTSNKSSLIELCKWFEENTGFENPFSDAILQTHQNGITRNAKYTDMMLYKLSA
jgi:hypothetical protein